MTGRFYMKTFRGKGSIGRKTIMMEKPKKKFKLIGNLKLPNPTKLNGRLMRVESLRIKELVSSSIGENSIFD